MKLLITTQKVDSSDSVLGFFHAWVREFANHFEEVTVISLWVGGVRNLPANVRVLELGKGQGGSRWQYLRRFRKLVKEESKNYDAVFCHMNPEYIVLAGNYWKKTGKKIALWFVHKAVPPTLRLAAPKVDMIFTASKSSFNLPSNKLKVLGHGIDLEQYRLQRIAPSGRPFRIIYVGRISQIKNQELLIKAIDILVNEWGRKDIQVDLIGGTVYKKDNFYLESLIKMVKDKELDNVINFTGPISNQEIIKYYQEANLSLNLCPTGGVDKAVLESMACGVSVIVHNQAFREILHDHDEMIRIGCQGKRLRQKECRDDA